MRTSLTLVTSSSLGSTAATSTRRTKHLWPDSNKLLSCSLSSEVLCTCTSGPTRASLGLRCRVSTRTQELTQAVAGINSLNSNRWNPRIQSNASKGVWGIQEEPGRQQEEACGRYRSSSVHPDRFPPFLRQAWWYVRSIQSWSRLGTVSPVLSVHHIILSSHKFARQPITMFLNNTHHEVLDCIAAAAFRTLSPSVRPVAFLVSQNVGGGTQ